MTLHEPRKRIALPRLASFAQLARWADRDERTMSRRAHELHRRHGGILVTPEGRKRPKVRVSAFLAVADEYYEEEVATPNDVELLRVQLFALRDVVRRDRVAFRTELRNAIAALRGEFDTRLRRLEAQRGDVAANDVSADANLRASNDGSR